MILSEIPPLYLLHRGASISQPFFVLSRESTSAERTPRPSSPKTRSSPRTFRCRVCSWSLTQEEPWTSGRGTRADVGGGSSKRLVSVVVTRVGEGGFEEMASTFAGAFSV